LARISGTQGNIAAQAKIVTFRRRVSTLQTQIVHVQKEMTTINYPENPIYCIVHCDSFELVRYCKIFPNQCFATGQSCCLQYSSLENLLLAIIELNLTISQGEFEYIHDGETFTETSPPLLEQLGLRNPNDAPIDQGPRQIDEE